MDSQLNSDGSTELWIFGYGSLIWKVDFKIEYSLRGEKFFKLNENSSNFQENIDKWFVGYIKGFERKFYQNSTDHRGTRENPGRVVTLIKNPEAKTYGKSYKIGDQDKQDVLKHLDVREINGYERVETLFYPIDQDIKPKKIILYLATETNPSYAGHKNDLLEIAHQIFQSNSGASGRNREYVYNLANSMRTLFPEVKDEHLFDLEKLLQEMEANEDAGNL